MITDECQKNHSCSNAIYCSGSSSIELEQDVATIASEVDTRGNLLTVLRAGFSRRLRRNAWARLMLLVVARKAALWRCYGRTTECQTRPALDLNISEETISSTRGDMYVLYEYESTTHVLVPSRLGV